MNNDIKLILEDLYAVDPDLKVYEQELVRIIMKMIKSQPDTKFSEQFKEELKALLFAKAAEIKLKKQKNQYLSFQGLRFWQAFSAVSFAAIIALLLIVPALKNYELLPVENIKFSLFNDKLELVTENAQSFGDLSLLKTSVPDGKGGGIEGGIGGGGKVSSDLAAELMPMEIINYEFVYKGDDFSITENELPILKRIKGYSAQDFSAWLKSLNLGLIDSAQFNNLKVQHLSLAEDKDFGYAIDITPYEGSLNITENWLKWNYMNANQSQLTLSDIPDDQSLISLADKFLKDYKINADLYGQPEVDKEWRLFYDQLAGRPEAYIPENVVVKYPLKINDKIVYDQSGNKTGIMVNINVRQKKVSGVYGIFTQKYQSSNYQTETNAQRIINLVNKGGLYGPYQPENHIDIKTVTIEIGTPVLQYIQYWQYENNESNELLVPAYIFPITSVSDNEVYYAKNIAIPVIKDILDSYDAAISTDQPIPMPLIK